MTNCTPLPTSYQHGQTGTPKEEFTIHEKVWYRYETGNKLADRFAEAARRENDIEALVGSDLLKATFSRSNFFWSEDFINYETGETFGGHGVIAQFSSSRLNASYNALQARRQRKKITAQIKDVKILVGCRYRFLTLTLPFLKTSFPNVVAIKERAFTLFRKRHLWVDNVQGAFAGEESTVGSCSSYFQTHHHLHAHCLVLSKYMEWSEIETVWTDCVEKACQEYGVECVTDRTTNRIHADVRDVAKRAWEQGKSVEQAVLELCKYVVKGSDYHKLSDRELLVVEKTLSNRQMVRRYGCFNERGENTPSQNSHSVGETPSLDTKCIVDGESDQPKRETLKQTGVRLCKEGKRVEWLEYRDAVMDQRREWRRLQLSVLYPHAVFHTLAGETWSGVSVRRPEVVSIDDYRRRDARE